MPTISNHINNCIHLSDGALSWVARGPALEVFGSVSGARRATWCFGAAIRDPSVNISAITEYPMSERSGSFLLVGTTIPNTDAGLLCLFDIKASRVVKAIEMPFMVSSCPNHSFVQMSQFTKVQGLFFPCTFHSI